MRSTACRRAGTASATFLADKIFRLVSRIRTTATRYPAKAQSLPCHLARTAIRSGRKTPYGFRLVKMALRYASQAQLSGLSRNVEVRQKHRAHRKTKQHHLQ